MNQTLETYDYLIARSGIVGRQILKLARGMLAGNGVAALQTGGLAGFWQEQVRHNRLIIIRGFSRLVITFYTYYIGGSLTRHDQQTFGRLNGMNGRSYRLTLFNALFCGLPCAAGYFLLGEGFGLLKGIHSLAEIPSLIAQHTSLAIGLLSLTVDLFRMVDSFWNRRCWAPFGVLPTIINLPTYLKRIVTYVRSGTQNTSSFISKAQTKKS